MTGEQYMARVASLPCAVCRRLGFINPRVEVHHQRSGTGGGRRASDFNTMPLCYPHHRGDEGIHGLGTKAFARTYGVTERELVEETRAQLGVTGEEVQAWEQAHRDARRDRARKRARGPKVARSEPARSRWPRRRLASSGSLRAGARGRD